MSKICSNLEHWLMWKDLFWKVTLQSEWELWSYLGRGGKKCQECPWDHWTDRYPEVTVKKCGSDSHISVVFPPSLRPVTSLHLWLSICRPVSFLWRSCWLCMATQCQIQRRRPVTCQPACQAWHWTRWDTTWETPAHMWGLIHNFYFTLKYSDWSDLH